VRAKPLSFLLIFVLLSSNAYASGMKGLAVFVLGIYIVPFLIPILSIPFISKSPKTIIVLNSFSSVFFIILFFYAGGFTPSPFSLLGILGLALSIFVISKTKKALG
jgi:hypothetical protein